MSGKRTCYIGIISKKGHFKNVGYGKPIWEGETTSPSWGENKVKQENLGPPLVLTHRRREKLSKDIPKFNIAFTGSPNSCLTQIGKNKFRSLVDSWAKVILMHTGVYQSLKKKPPLIKKNTKLQTVSSTGLKLDRFVNFCFQNGGYLQKMKHFFNVSPSTDRNVILRRDWVDQNGVRLCFDLGFLWMGNMCAFCPGHAYCFNSLHDVNNWLKPANCYCLFRKG